MQVAAEQSGADVTAATRVQRRRLWPVVLISSALLLLAVGAIAIGQLYWGGLHTGMARMRVSIDQASRRQVLLAEQVRAAEVLLRARQTELDRREAELDARDGRHEDADAKRQGRHPDDQRRDASSTNGLSAAWAAPGLLPVSLDAVDRRRLHALLVAINRDIARLLPPVRRGPQLGARSATLSNHRAVKAQLQVAETALALGDPVLLDLTTAAAQRLLLQPYGASAPRAQEVARQLTELRAALRKPRFRDK